MQRIMRFCMLVGILSLSVHEAAAAGDSWWGWLEELSGPGPFNGTFPGTSLGENFCSKNNKVNFRQIGIGTQNGAVSCIWADQRFFRARPDARPQRGFPEVQLSLYDAGVSLSYKYFVTVGAGAGLARFVSTGATDDIVKTSFTITPVRVTVSPLELIPQLSRPLRNDKWRQTFGAVKYYGKVICFPGRLTGADFGAPNSPFRSDGECKLSHGIQFDILDLVGLSK